MRGAYKHFKGGHYFVYGVAYHTETDEPMVVYTPDTDGGDFWVRPLDMFNEEVEWPDGEMRPRFEKM